MVSHRKWLTKYFKGAIVGKRLPTSIIRIERYLEYEKSVC
jgi:hypothetical protein